MEKLKRGGRFWVIAIDSQGTKKIEKTQEGGLFLGMTIKKLGTAHQKTTGRV